MSLICEHVTAMAGKRAVLSDVDVAFRKGRVTAILGPNGAGKSTLLNCAVAQRRIARGRVLLDGEDVSTMRARDRARRIGYLPQAAELHWNLLGRDVVALGRMPHRSAFAALGPEDEAAIERAMAATDSRAFADRPAGELSGGERGRVMLARVLAGEPEWLLADEPLASLDPAHQIDILDRLRGVAEAGTGVLLVLHDLTQAMRVADDALLISEGRVAAFGPVGETLTPDVLRAVYGVEVYVGRAADGAPLLVPTRRSR